MPHRLPDLPAPPKAAPLVRQVPVQLLLAGFVLVIAIVVGVAVFTFGLRGQTREVEERYQTIVDATDVLGALKDAETGQRGYLLTGDEAYLQPYESSMATLAARLDTLTARVADDPLGTGKGTADSSGGGIRSRAVSRRLDHQSPPARPHPDAQDLTPKT